MQHRPENAAEKIVIRADPDLEDLIPGYLDRRREDLRVLQDALERRDYETIRSLGHKMKGSGGGYGFVAITEIGRTLEQAAKDRDSDEARRRIGELAAYLERVEVVYREVTG